MKKFKHIGTGDRNLEFISHAKAWELIEESPTNIQFILETTFPIAEENYNKICAILAHENYRMAHMGSNVMIEHAEKPRHSFN